MSSENAKDCSNIDGVVDVDTKRYRALRNKHLNTEALLCLKSRLTEGWRRLGGAGRRLGGAGRDGEGLGGTGRDGLTGAEASRQLLPAGSVWA